MFNRHSEFIKVTENVAAKWILKALQEVFFFTFISLTHFPHCFNKYQLCIQLLPEIITFILPLLFVFHIIQVVWTICIDPVINICTVTYFWYSFSFIIHTIVNIESIWEIQYPVCVCSRVFHTYNSYNIINLPTAIFSPLHFSYYVLLKISPNTV
jgi:hypothetical protein